MSGKDKSLSLLNILYSPFIKDSQSVKKIMWLVVLSLVPANIFAVYIYGLNAAAIIISSVISSVIAEAAFQLLMKKPVSVSDGSAVVTGLLFAMSMPPAIPVYITALGAFFAIIIVKQLFGGLGYNIFNPALGAWAFVMALRPSGMTDKFIHSDSSSLFMNMPFVTFDAVTQGSPLSLLKEIPAIPRFGTYPDHVYDLIFSDSMLGSLFFGNTGGCLGEISALLLLIGAIFLLLKRVITWHIPVAFAGSAALFLLIFYNITEILYPVRAVVYHLLSGGLILSAFFMATDTVTSPVTKKGMIIFGAGCGILTCVIRIWGNYLEGVCYAVLLMNAAVPLIDKYTRPKAFGK